MSDKWHFRIALLGVGLVLLLAFAGPLLAPKDPLQENYIAKINGRFVIPPFPPLVLADYPLGSDEFGRDIFSRLLWAVRPTLVMVAVIAALRIILGTLIGLAAGWLEGWPRRFLNSLISASLALPVLFVALLVIAVAGKTAGMAAFIAGISLTGWAEPARLVQEQTRRIKMQPFIESTRSLGAASGQIILSHVLPHIAATLWLMLALEISSAMLTVAALGFLGYFVNSVWVPLGDWSSIRASGSPELGQMLGGSITQKQPWSAAAAGTVIVWILLSFNILSKALRQRLEPRLRSPSAITRPLAALMEKGSIWLEERLYMGAAGLQRTTALLAAGGLLLFVLLGGGYFLWQSQQIPTASSAVTIPGGAAWASKGRDAQGTFWTDAVGPGEGGLLWLVDLGRPLAGGLAMGADGTIYAVSKQPALHAVSPQGQQVWTLALPFAPLGTPAIRSDGAVLVLGAKGEVLAASPQGEQLWLFQPEINEDVLDSPIISAAGNVYYLTTNRLRAVEPDGNLLWDVRIPTYSYVTPELRLDPTEEFLFMEDVAVNALIGKTAFGQLPGMMDRYSVGANGNVYVLEQDILSQWLRTEKGASLAKMAQLDARALNLGLRFPLYVGVSPSAYIWLYFSGRYEYARVAFMDPAGQAPVVLDYPYRASVLVGFDRANTVYVCGSDDKSNTAECRANRLMDGGLVWKTSLEKDVIILDGALVEGRLYACGDNGRIYAIGPLDGAAPAVIPPTAAAQASASSGPVSTPAPSPTPRPTSTATPRPAIATPVPTRAMTLTATPNVTPAVAPSATATLPAEVVLQRGEYPYCIARRFNVDAAALMALNGLSPEDTYFAGRKLKIPAGPVYQGQRRLKEHPASYTVQAGDTVNGIACAFGDVLPEDIIHASHLESPYTLTTGQVLNIP